MENANLLSAIPVSGRLFTRSSNYLNFHKRLITYCALIGHHYYALHARPRLFAAPFAN
jgi:hypothetical protein